MSLHNLSTDSNNREIFAHSVHTQIPIAPLSSFYAYNTAGQTLLTNANTPIVFNALIVADPNYNSATSEYTIPTTGDYFFNFNVQLTFVVAGGAANSVILGIALMVDGVVHRQATLATDTVIGQNYIQDMTLSFYGPFAAGEVVTVESLTPVVNGGPAGALGTYNAALDNTYLMGEFKRQA